MTSKFIRHEKCPSCGSSDAKAVYSDGHGYCFSCEAYFESELDEPLTVSKSQEDFYALVDRGISSQTAKKYGVRSTRDPQGGVETHVYPYFDKLDRQVDSKTRIVKTKQFTFTGSGGIKSAGLFGRQAFPAGSAKAITIFEGECDAMAGFELTGSRFPCLSVKNGASGAVKDITDDFEYVNSFPEIIICFDKDDPKVMPDGSVRYPGQDAAIAVANLFEPGKVRVLTLAEHKDANEYLLHDKRAQFVKEWWAAPRYTPSGLKLGSTMWDEISTPKNYDTVPYPFEGLNTMTYGIRLSEFIVVTAESGIGKTAILREITHKILTETEKKKYGIGLLCFEETNADTALGLMSIAANKPLHLPDVREQVSKDELKKYYDQTVNTDRVVIWDHFGSNSIHEVLAKIRHMHNLGCKYIILDHLSIVVSDQSGDERKQLDEISTKIKTLCMELNIAVIAVIHQNRAGQIRGTAGVEQLANMVIKLRRNKEDVDPWRRNVTEVMITKNRFCGLTGPSCYLFYQPETGRLVELDREEVDRFINGESGGEAPW